jgi:Na+-transporting methylmalonyl-CoA/oxaloacetate decarboxylase gamma subunit
VVLLAASGYLLNNKGGVHMEKAISFFQKSIGYISLAVYCLMFIYALGMATPAASLLKYQEERDFYSGVQGYNNGILVLAIFGLLISAFYLVLRNNKRKIYYVSNFTWMGVGTVYALISGIYTIVGVSAYQKLYMALDFDTINAYWAERSLDLTINKNTPVFGLGYVLAILVILIIVPIVLVLINKIIGRIQHEKKNKALASTTKSSDSETIKESVK